MTLMTLLAGAAYADVPCGRGYITFYDFDCVDNFWVGMEVGEGAFADGEAGFTMTWGVTTSCAHVYRDPWSEENAEDCSFDLCEDGPAEGTRCTSSPPPPDPDPPQPWWCQYVPCPPPGDPPVRI